MEKWKAIKSMEKRVKFLRTTEGGWFVKDEVVIFRTKTAEWFVENGYCEFIKEVRCETCEGTGREGGKASDGPWVHRGEWKSCEECHGRGLVGVVRV